MTELHTPSRSNVANYPNHSHQLKHMTFYGNVKVVVPLQNKANIVHHEAEKP
jgi:hypothetical protein